MTMCVLKPDWLALQAAAERVVGIVGQVAVVAAGTAAAEWVFGIVGLENLVRFGRG